MANSTEIKLIAQAHAQQFNKQQNDYYLQMANNMIAENQQNEKYLQMANDMIANENKVSQPVQTQNVQPVETVQQKTVSEVKKIPSIVDFGKNQDNKTYIQKVIEQNILKQQEVGKPYGPMIEEARAQKQNEPSTTKEQRKEDSAPIGSGINQVDISKYNLPINNGFTNDDIKAYEDYDKAVAWTQPDYRLTKEEQKEAKRIARQGIERLEKPTENTTGAPVYVGRSVKDMTPEEQKEYQMYKDLELRSNGFLSGAVGAADKLLQQGESLANTELQLSKKYGDLFSKLGIITPEEADRAIDALENARQGVKDFDKDYVEDTRKIAQGAAPIASPTIPILNQQVDITPYGTGQMGTQIAEYFLTNPVFDALGDAAKVGKVGKFLINQVGQNLQDVALDTSFLVSNALDDGEITEDEANEIKSNMAWNAAFNLGLGALGEVPGLVKKVVNNKAAKKAAQTIPEITDAIKQTENAAENIDNFAKQIPNIEDATDIYKGIDNYNVDLKAPETPNVELPAETFNKLDSHFEELARPMNDVKNSGIMDKVTDAKALKEWQAVNEAYDSYIVKAMDGTVEEVEAAKKSFDNARKRYARAMKNIDPEIAKQFNSGSYGNLTGRPLYERNIALQNEANAQATADIINELENLEPVKNVEQSIDNAPHNRGIEEVNLKNGKKGYFVAETSGDVSKNIEPGKVYKSKEEAQKALEDYNLQFFGGEKGVNEPNWKVSEAYTNTGKRGGGWTADEYAKHTKEHNFLYESIDEARSIEEATKMRATEGRQAFKNRALYSDRLSSVELDGLMMEWRDLTREARELEAAGKRADTKWIDANKIFRKIQEESTNNAQALQALAKWSRNTPEGLLVQAENIINGKTKVPETALQKALAKYSKRKNIQFSDDFMKKFLDTAKPLDGLSGDQLDTREAKDIMSKLGKMVNEQLPVKLNEKLQTFLMDNMLGNFRTLITRNAGGNVGLNAIEQTLERPLAAGIDSLVSLKTGKRTQAGLSKQGIVDYLSGFKKGLADEVTDFKLDVHTARSGENTLANAINSNRRIFKNKLMNFGDKLVRHGLSVGDRPFYEAVYKQTVGDYNALYNKGLMGETIQNLSPEEFKAYSEVAAKLNALGAVYQQDTALSNALMGFKKDIGMLSEGTIGVDILSQFSMPFVKTPANVIERAIDYSPLGIVRNTFRTGKELKAGVFDQNRFVNEAARNILGTTLMGGGAALAANGAMSGSYSDNKNQKQAQKESGMQEYAWNVPEQIPGIGGKQMDISWAPVIGSNLVASAAAVDAYNKGKGDTVGNLATGLKAGGQSLFDQSMFQGLQRLFGSGESYNSDEGIVANMSNVVKSGVGQGIPSLARQIAQVSDKYQRDLSGSNKDTSFGPFGNYDINSLANNIPGLRQEYLAPKVNTSGELMMENQGRGLGMKILEDMILPGKLTEIQANKLTEEANRLSEITTNATAYIPKADRSVLDTEDHVLSNDEWVDYQQKYYKELNAAGEQLIDSDYYKGLDDVTKESTLSNVYSAIRTAINSEYTGKEVDGASKKYVEAGGGEDGINAVLNYYTAKNMSDEAGLSTSSNAAKEIQKDIESGNLEAAEQKKDAAIRLPELGLDKPAATYAYYKAQEQIPGLTVEDFANTYKAIDKDHNQSLKKNDEVIPYMNSQNMNYNDGMAFWNAYASSNWKTPSYDSNTGKWK